jgi:hypothetical protein
MGAVEKVSNYRIFSEERWNIAQRNKLECLEARKLGGS